MTTLPVDYFFLLYLLGLQTNHSIESPICDILLEYSEYICLFLSLDSLNGRWMEAVTCLPN